jgi:hypothetical protein
VVVRLVPCTENDIPDDWIFAPPPTRRPRLTRIFRLHSPIRDSEALRVRSTAYWVDRAIMPVREGWPTIVRLRKRRRDLNALYIHRRGIIVVERYLVKGARRAHGLVGKRNQLGRDG